MMPGSEENMELHSAEARIVALASLEGVMNARKLGRNFDEV